MASNRLTTREDVLKRAIWLYGLLMLVSNAVYLFAYYFLPEGFMRGSPPLAAARFAATGIFWSEFARILLVNIGWVVVIGVLLNLVQIKGFSFGYLFLLVQGLVANLVSGTNSFVSSDMSQFNVREGTALALSIGGLEMLGYTLAIASTVGLAVYNFSGLLQWKPTKVMNLRDIRLSRAEVLCLIAGILLLIFAAYRETLMVVNR